MTYFTRLRFSEGADFGYDADFEHKRIMALFPEMGERARLEANVLWRRAGERSVYVQSDVAPNEAHYRSGFPGTVDVTDSADVRAREILAGGEVMFNARLHAVRRQGKKEFVVFADSIQDWSARVLNARGFEPVTLTAVKEKPVPLRRGDRTIHLSSALVEGVVRVVDPELAFSSWRSGIGRGKAYGFGMVALRPAS